MDCRKTKNGNRGMMTEKTGLKLLNALLGIEPYIEAIICYASTLEEHEPNRLAKNCYEAIDEALRELRSEEPAD